MKFAAGLIAMGLVSALVAVGVVLVTWPAGDDNDTRAAITVREDRGPPAVAAPDAPLEPPAEFQSMQGVGFDRAPAALPSATALMPFPVGVPAYLPQGMTLWGVRATLFEPAGDGGTTELYYTLPPDGTTRPAVHIIQSTAEGPVEVTPPSGAYPAVKQKGTFTAQGSEWRYKVLVFPDLNILVADTTTPAGVWIEADIRVIGTDEGTALAELQKVLESLA